MVKKIMADANEIVKSKDSEKPGFIKWAMMSLWYYMLKPLAVGIIFGCGNMLGMYCVRYFLMSRLGIVDYKEFQRPGSVNTVASPGK